MRAGLRDDFTFSSRFRITMPQEGLAPVLPSPLPLPRCSPVNGVWIFVDASRRFREDEHDFSGINRNPGQVAGWKGAYSGFVLMRELVQTPWPRHSGLSRAISRRSRLGMTLPLPPVYPVTTCHASSASRQGVRSFAMCVAAG